MNNIASKISLINQTVTASLLASDSNEIIKNFTETSIKVLEADWGYFWGRLHETEKYKLVYKSKNYPKNPGQSKKNSFTIPIKYFEHVYGNIVVCYKKNVKFNSTHLALAENMGNALAQTIHTLWMVEKEQTTLSMAEKQKETEVLLAQEKIKTEFISNATHELRTPLAIIRGNVDLALSGESKSLKSKQSALLAIRTEVAHLSSILADLSILIAPEQNKKNIIHPSPLDLTEFIKEIAGRIKVLALKKGVTIDVKKSPSFFISGDKKYLEKLFLNIIKNAITYGRNGGRIVVELKKSDKKVTVSINDDGIGIPKEDLPFIFERFYRVDKSHSSYGKHSGLGLAIAKLITEAHGGTIEVKSSLGKGTTFYTTFSLIKNPK